MEWSIVREHLFPVANGGTQPMRAQLNPDGLFATEEGARACADWYLAASRRDLAEPLADDARLEPVGIYALE